jgi:hypothetical protein
MPYDKVVMNKKKYVKTSVAIWMFYNANYVPYITKTNWIASYLTRRKEAWLSLFHVFYQASHCLWKMFDSIQDMK